MNYNIYNEMQCPLLIGTPSKTSFTSVVESVSNNMQSYIAAYPFSGVNSDMAYGQVEPDTGFYTGRDYALGSNFFMKSGLICDKKTSSHECKGKPNWTYVRNIPSGKIPLLGDISFQGITGCNIDGLTEGRGLLSGILEDISDISPLAIGEAVLGKGNTGSTTCKTISYPVGTHIYDPLMECKSGSNCEKKTWQMESKCSSSTKHLKMTTDTQSTFQVPGALGIFNETFTDKSSENFSSKEDEVYVARVFLISLVFFIVAVLLLLLLYYEH
jgi:hypothetical protein